MTASQAVHVFDFPSTQFPFPSRAWQRYLSQGDSKAAHLETRCQQHIFMLAVT